MNSSTLLNQWPLTLLLTTLTLVVSLLIAGVGGDIAALRHALLVNARLAMLFFLVAFVASSLAQVWKHPASLWLVKNRRYLGVSFAAAFGIHALFIGYRFTIDDDFRTGLDPHAVVAGGIVVALALLMALTSNSVSQRYLGVMWKVFHTLASYYIFLIFAVTDAARAAHAPRPYLVYVALLACILVLRLRRSIVSLSRRFGGKIAS